MGQCTVVQRRRCTCNRNCQPSPSSDGALPTSSDSLLPAQPRCVTAVGLRGDALLLLEGSTTAASTASRGSHPPGPRPSVRGHACPPLPDFTPPSMHDRSFPAGRRCFSPLPAAPAHSGLSRGQRAASYTRTRTARPRAWPK